MNKNKQALKSASRWILALVGAAVVFSLVFTIPSGTALAAPGIPTRTPGTGKASQELSQAYQHEQQALGQQQANLGRTGEVVSKIQDLISNAKGKGLDTSALSSTLATFQAEIATASSSNVTAASILSAHNGFDGSGNVTDPVAAHQTVQDARQNLMDAHTRLVQAAADLHTAVRAWEEANKDKFQDQNLQKGLQNEQKALTFQQANLGRTNNIVTNVQELISKAQTKGLDTSALSTALATFQAEIATASSSDATAAGILGAHDGFDGSGNVTDQAAAAQTVKDAHQSLTDARTMLIQAVNDLQKAVNQWRQTNGPALAPAATSTGG
jgi:hypothetical protein